MDRNRIFDWKSRYLETLENIPESYNACIDRSTRRLPWGLQGNRIKFSRDAIHNSIINPRESWDGSLCSPLLNEQLYVTYPTFRPLSSNPIARIGKKKERKGKGKKKEKEEKRKVKC